MGIFGLGLDYLVINHIDVIIYSIQVMEKKMIFEQITNLKIGEVLKDEPMSKYTTFRIGGPADIFVKPKDEEALIKLIKYLRKEGIEYFILGQGSNLLVSDKGIRGVVIALMDCLKDLEVEDDIITTGAGNLVPAVSRLAQRNSLSGMEPLSGIPGTIGGGLVMNAGAYGGEFKDIVIDVKVLNKDSEVEIISNKDMNFRYRGSDALEKEHLILGTRLQLKKKPQEEIDTLMQELTEQRVLKQPLNLPSAGSTFKRPEGHFAAALIEEAGLKGLIHRGVRVSDKHSGFIVNHDNGSFNDVLQLIKLVQKEVYDYSGIMLEPEIKIIGENI